MAGCGSSLCKLVSPHNGPKHGLRLSEKPVLRAGYAKPAIGILVCEFVVIAVVRSCQMAVESQFYSGQILSPILACDHGGPLVSGGGHQNFPMF